MVPLWHITSRGQNKQKTQQANFYPFGLEVVYPPVPKLPFKKLNILVENIKTKEEKKKPV